MTAGARAGDVPAVAGGIATDRAEAEPRDDVLPSPLGQGGVAVPQTEETVPQRSSAGEPPATPPATSRPIEPIEVRYGRAVGFLEAVLDIGYLPPGPLADAIREFIAEHEQRRAAIREANERQASAVHDLLHRVAESLEPDRLKPGGFIPGPNPRRPR